MPHKRSEDKDEWQRTFFSKGKSVKTPRGKPLAAQRSSAVALGALVTDLG